MKLINEEFPILSQSHSKTYNQTSNYLEDFSFISRHIFFRHCLSYLYHIKEEIGKQSYNANYGITDSQMKGIQQEQRSVNAYNLIVQQYANWKNWKNGSPFEARDISLILLKTFLSEIVVILVLLLMDSLIRLLISIIVLSLLKAISQNHEREAFGYSAIICLCWYIKQLFKQQGYLRTNLLSIKIKSSLVTLILTKISYLSSYNIKSMDKGKVTNLLSSDIEPISQKLIDILKSCIIPVQWIGSTIILIVRLGWPGLLFTGIVILSIPLNVYLSKRNSHYIREIKNYRDKRTQMTVDIIKDIQNVKYYGQEQIINSFIQKVRQQQTEHYEKLNFGKVLQQIYDHFMGIIISLVMLIAAQVIQYLSQAAIFSCLQVILSFKISLQVLSISVDAYFEKDVVFQRLASILNLEIISMIKLDQEDSHTHQPFIRPQRLSNRETNDGDELGSQRQLYYNLQKEEQIKECIKLQQFSSYLMNDIRNPMLKDVNYSFLPKKMYGIMGKIGSGKTTFLKALINDLPYFSGNLYTKGTISFIQQQPIIMWGTIRSNILYGQQFDIQAYQKVITYCCLWKDIKQFPKGDDTEIYQGGSNISKGQRSKISLARALYKNTDIILIDNIFSNFDKKIADKIFNNCLKRIVQQKTVILVTYQKDYLQQCDEIIAFQGGEIIKCGIPADFKEIFLQQKYFSQQLSYQKQQFEEKSQIKIAQGPEINRNITSQINIDMDIVHQQVDKQKQVKVTFITLINYLFQGKNNKIIFTFSFILFLINQVLIVLFFRLLVYDEDIENGNPNPISNNLTTFWTIQGIIVLGYLLILFLKNYLFSKLLINSSLSIYEKMMRGIIRSPAKSITSIPSGLLINRISNDLNYLDQSVSLSVLETLQDMIAIITAIINVSQLDVYLIPAVIVIFIIILVFYINARYIIIQCLQKSLKDKTKIYSILEQMVQSITHIKLYNLRQNYINKFTNIADRLSTSSVAFQLASRGFELYSSVLIIILMFIGLMVGAIQIGESSPAIYSVTAIFLINFNQLFPRFLKQLIKTETVLLYYQRVIRVAEITPQKTFRNQYDSTIGLAEEVIAYQNKKPIRINWPKQANMNMQNLNTQYGVQFSSIFQNFSFSVQNNQKICIFGQTASGKSSLIQSIFRLIEPNNQTLLQIGSFDAKQMGIHSLRMHISIVPQKPFLIKGTLRQNIDPALQFSDNYIWEKLESVGLSHQIRNLPQQLQTDTSKLEVGFSVGQRKLLCLAKALLMENRYLVLDDLMSYFDPLTKANINNIIDQKLATTTVIAVANRICKMNNYQKIIILKNGKNYRQIQKMQNKRQQNFSKEHN